MEKTEVNSRRKFISKLAGGTAVGLTAMAYPFQSFTKGNPMIPVASVKDAEEWIKKAKGSHRTVFDAPEPNGGFPFIWTWVFYTTNNTSGTPDNDMTGMVVLRHNGMPFAMEDRLWKKYNLGENFGILDSNKKPMQRNPYYNPQEGDYPFPGIDGIKRLQERGAMFCVCDMALTVYSTMIANKSNLDPANVKEDWVSGIHKDIQIVPSGVWAVGRAQENGFGYCYAGG